MPFLEDKPAINCDKCHNTKNEGEIVVCNRAIIHDGALVYDKHEHGELTYCSDCFDKMTTSQTPLTKQQITTIWDSFSPTTQQAYIHWIKAHMRLNKNSSDSYEITSEHSYEELTSSTSSLTKLKFGKIIASNPDHVTFYCSRCQKTHQIVHIDDIELDLLNHLFVTHDAVNHELLEEISCSSSLLKSKKTAIEKIHSYLQNEECRKCVELIKEYGQYDFFADYATFLEENYPLETRYSYLKNLTTSFMVITNR